MRTKVLIVNEELSCRKLIRNYLELAGGFHVVEECSNCLDAMRAIRNSAIDVLFLDAELSGMTGMEFLRSFSPHPQVILTSASDSFALEGYSLNVLDYLLKPIRFKRFMMALDKYKRTRPQPASYFFTETKGHDQEFLYIQESKRIIKIFVRDICFIEETNGILNIQTESQRIQARDTLEQMAKKLSDGTFLRIHSRYLVSVNRIKAFNQISVELDQATLPIERKYREQTFLGLQYTPDLWHANLA